VAVAVAVWIATGQRGTHRPHGGAPRLLRASHPIPRRAPARAGPGELAADLNAAEQIIHSRRSSSRARARAGLLEELATGVLERERARTRRATLVAADARASASMRTDLVAAAALSGLAERRTRLPPWRIIAPPAPSRLLRFFRGAQVRTRVPWQYLAAIELVETRFGRIRGPSSAGAQGPMQFLPTTWSLYGRGSINDPRAAIFAAARLLAANGAPADMAGALRHYNDSSDYVTAVRAYARHMERDPRSYDGYYGWQVVYAYAHRTVILPVGFPAARPTPLPSARGLSLLVA
jgi:hypothetical protein